MNPDSRSGDPLALLDDYDFELPEASIAQAPPEHREDARLLVLDRQSGAIVDGERDQRIRDLPEWLRPGDLLVVNATRVLAAKLVGRKVSGGSAEALLLGPAVSDSPNVADRAEGATASDYRALVKCTGRLREGLEFRFGDPETPISASVRRVHPRGEVTLRFEPSVDPYAHGEAPLPPYIERRGTERRGDDPHREDLERYQTVFAREPGAIAAPTAGLHLTRSLLERLREGGVGTAEVVLHVGVGTFRPIEASAIETGRLHAERFELPAETVEAVERTRSAGGRVIAVGTTTTRVLESRVDERGRLEAGTGETELFIRPGGPPFRVVDGLLTNFHLPRSSLLLLVSEFVGRRELLDAYAHAIREGFRFYSYGDAMLILPDADRPGRDEP